MEDMAKTADKLLVMNGGKVEMFGSVSDVFKNADRLLEVGLDIPEITKIALGLKEKGFNIKTDVYTVEGLKNEILRIAKRVEL